MKLVNYEYLDTCGIGILGINNKIIPLNNMGLSYKYLPTLLQNINTEQLNEIRQLSTKEGNISLSDIKFKSPIKNAFQGLICIGINYVAHKEESNRYKKNAFDSHEVPVYFAKRSDSSLGHEGIVPTHHKLTATLDYECELGVVIGIDAKNVKKEDAYKHIFGLTIINDITARDIQLKHNQWFAGKSLEGCLTAGPFVVSMDEFSLPLEIGLKTYVNGELRQDSNTKHMIYDIPYVIEELSSYMPLRAGTVISMGTPEGVGMGLIPPVFLKHGDVVKCEIEGIGTLENTFKDMG